MKDEELPYSPYHEWGDQDFDWKSLDDACIYLSKNCKRWARLGVWTKEKYGTMRVTVWMGLYEPFQNLIYPGYARAMFPRWFRHYIDFPLGDLIHFLRISKPIYWYQLQVLKFFWKRAAKKWPHIAAEILDDYDFTMRR